MTYREAETWAQLIRATPIEPAAKREAAHLERRADDRKAWLAELLTQQRGRCHYCRAPIVPGKKRRRHGARLATFDHVIRSRGGADARENGVAACDECNNAKADRLPEEWRQAA